MSHDWNQYREQFPSRYWQQGEFDERLNHYLNTWQNEKPIKTALDIGGGVLGTLTLRDFAQKHEVQSYLLDPFVQATPAWIKANLHWNDKIHVDLAVARGSINYMTTEQLQLIPHMLNEGGHLIANTFLTAPPRQWSEREVSNAQGDKGIERSRLYDMVVEHEIIFPTYHIKHSFFYYTEQEFRNYLGNIEIINYGKNSAIIILST